MKRFHLALALLACAAAQACNSSRSNSYEPVDREVYDNQVPAETASTCDMRTADARHVHGGACGHYDSGGRWYFDPEHQYPVGE